MFLTLETHKKSLRSHRAITADDRRRRNGRKQQEEQMERGPPDLRDDVATQRRRAGRRRPPVHVRGVAPREVVVHALICAAEPEAPAPRGVSRRDKRGQVDIQGHGAEQHGDPQVRAVSGCRAAHGHGDGGERRRAGELEALRSRNQSVRWTRLLDGVQLTRTPRETG